MCGMSERDICTASPLASNILLVLFYWRYLALFYWRYFIGAILLALFYWRYLALFYWCYFIGAIWRYLVLFGAMLLALRITNKIAIRSAT